MSPLCCRPNEPLSVRVTDASCISQQIICWYRLMDGDTHTFRKSRTGRCKGEAAGIPLFIMPSTSTAIKPCNDQCGIIYMLAAVLQDVVLVDRVGEISAENKELRVRIYDICTNMYENSCVHRSFTTCTRPAAGGGVEVPPSHIPSTSRLTQSVSDVINKLIT